MKSINSHFSIILSVFVLLFSYQFVHFTHAMIEEYGQNIVDDYAMVIVASTELKEETIKAYVPEMALLSEISSKKILDRLKNDMSSKNLSLLQVALPKFYSLKLESLPDKNRLEAIKQRLLENSAITRVETFAKTHDKVFKMFELLRYMVYVVALFMAILSVLLIFKQIRIWTYEHRRRMSIMGLFGASFFMKSAMLYRMSIVDSLISAILVCLVYTFVPHISIVQQFAQELSVTLPAFDFIYEGMPLIGLAIAFAIVSVSVVARNIGNA